MAPRYVVSDSEIESGSDEPGPSVPSDKALERALRDAVAKIYKSGKIEELTVKRVRLAVEKSLELDEGFFKASSEWKTKSEQIIKDEVEVQDKAAQEPEHEEDVSPPPSKTAKPTKRTKSTTTSTSRKRRKTSSPEPDEEEEEEAASESPSDSEVEAKKPTKRQPHMTDKKPQQKASKDIVSDESDLSEEPDVNPKEVEVDVKDHSESEMSIVLDEEPKPSRKRQKSADAPSQKAKKKTTTTTKTTTTKGKEADVEPDQAEIKRLQGWLVKCGIRKVWSRELAPYDTSKNKIKHLKDMLKEAGMDGRYSLEKAKKIKEARELKADLEMIQEGAKHWGKGEEEESDGGSRPRRRLNRGQQSLAFLESDGEETD